MSSLEGAPEDADELEALARQPYDADPDLNWSVALAPGLNYDGDAPADVLESRVRRITRVWQGRTTTADADRYEAHYRDEVLSSLRGVAGFRGARLL